jgi:hypothetical protein
MPTQPVWASKPEAGGGGGVGLGGGVGPGRGGVTAPATVNCRVVLAPRLPALSRERTSNVCAPAVSVPVVTGEVHGANSPLSMRQSNVVLASNEENVNVGVAEAPLPVGPTSMTVCGAAESSTYVTELEEQPETLLAASVDRA